jgi:hypothetical protein
VCPEFSCVGVCFSLTKTPVVGMRSRDGMLVAAKMDKVNSVNIQTMIDNHTDTNVTLCTLNQFYPMMIV